MKTKILIPIFALLMQVTVTAQTKESETESKISAVTVFFSGAQINRKATVNLQPGTNIIRFSRLSYYIDPNSIQVEGSNKYTIVSVNHRHNFLNDADELPEVKPLKAKIDKLTEELELLKIDMNANQEEREMILANKQFIGANKSVTVDEMMDMSELYQNKYAMLLKDHAEFQKKEKELKKDLKRHRDQMKVVTAGKNLYTSDIIVNLSSPAKTATELSFKYVTSNAGWTSAYDAKAMDVKNPLSLTYKAKVVQTTGEDWKNIKLTLSTGNPTRNNNRPTLATWQLSGYDQEEAERRRKAEENRYQNKEASKKREKTAEAGAPSMAGAEVDMLEEEETVSKDKSKSTASLTTVQQGAVSLEFSIAVPYTIASDGKDYTVEIARHELNASYRYYASPKYDNSAFLVSYISGWEKFNLMSGMASVYFGDNYIGQSYFNTSSTLDSLELSLGRDKSILLERKKIKDYAKPSLSGSTRKVTLGIELIVKNTRSSAIKLDLEDQYPVTRNKEIEVELIENGGATVKKETGTLTWSLEINPGETKTIRFAYSVKYPKDKDISNF